LKQYKSYFVETINVSFISFVQTLLHHEKCVAEVS